MEKYRFTAEKVFLGEEEGYMVNQIRDGEIAVSSFVLADEYDAFCSQIGIRPEIID